MPGYANSLEYWSLNMLKGLFPSPGATFKICWLSLSSTKFVFVNMVSVTPVGISTSSSLHWSSVSTTSSQLVLLEVLTQLLTIFCSPLCSFSIFLSSTKQLSLYSTPQTWLTVIPSCLYRLLLLMSQLAAWITLCGLTLKDIAELLYCNFLFKFTLIVPVSLGNLGNTLTVLDTSATTLTTFPRILNCLPLGACINFWNASLGARSLHSSSFKSKKSGFFGNCIPFKIAVGGTLFFIKYL